MLRLLAGLLALVGMQTARAETGEILFGSVAMDIPRVMYERLSPLTDYLSWTVGSRVTLRLSPDMSSAIAALAQGEVQLSYLTPVAYVRAHDEGGARIVVKTITQGRSALQLTIVVRDGSGFRKAADLKGKIFAFGDPAALLQRAVVVAAGLPLEAFGEYRFLGHYDNVARGVLAGDFDGGILKDTAAVEWEQQGLRVIHRSPDLPPYNISVSREVSDELYDRIRAAFLALDPANTAHLTIIKALDDNYDGFAPTSDAEYAVVRRLIAPLR
jgi:phosphonate transport system substrate-binding protein